MCKFVIKSIKDLQLRFELLLLINYFHNQNMELSDHLVISKLIENMSKKLSLLRIVRVDSQSLLFLGLSTQQVQDLNKLRAQRKEFAF